MADDAARIAQLKADLGQARSEARTWRAEAEHRDRALAEALDQQLATSDLLRIIASPGLKPPDCPQRRRGERSQPL